MENLLKTLYPDLEKEHLEKLDIDAILANADNINTSVQGKTIDDIHTEVFEALSELQGMTQPHLEDLCRKLAGYRYVEKLCDLQTGKGVRWVRKDSLKMTQGGMLVRVEFDDEKVKILCRNHRYFFKYAFDDCLSFQKLTLEEQLILLYQKNIDI
jgi:hypothetical protein